MNTNQKKYKQIYNKVANKLNISEDKVEYIYLMYWELMKEALLNSIADRVTCNLTPRDHSSVKKEQSFTGISIYKIGKFKINSRV